MEEVFDEDQQSLAKGAQSKMLVVGLGASAGGIKALKEFFSHVPAQSGVNPRRRKTVKRLGRVK